MSYLSLYRKYRPKAFSDVIGQQHIIRTVQNQIELDRISHAYLFCGTRGTGKTSTAKIFAKAINCENIVDGSPCGVCRSCKGIDSGSNLNVIEIDAASNNGVDNIREIRNEVKYPPTEGKYKVYVIDEVHMLSQGAFNALLKTLEEPPKHVVFILATTDPQKIPATIHSRCQRFDFKRIKVEDMVDEIKKYMANDEVNIDERALKYIAKLANGGMRDALSILDQCISYYYGEEITLDKVVEALGGVDNKIFFDFVETLINKDIEKAITLIDKLVLDGKDISQFVIELIEHLRNILVVMSTDSYENIVEVELENIQKLKEHAGKLTVDKIMNYITSFSEFENKLKYSSQKKIMLEVEAMRLCKPTFEVTLDSDVAEKIKELECRLDNANSISCAPKKKEIKKPVLKPKAVSEEIKKVVTLWNDIRSNFELPIKAATDDTEAGYLEDDIFYVVCKNEIMVEYVVKKVPYIKQKVEEFLGKTVNVKTIKALDFGKKYREFYGAPEESEETYDENMEKMISRFKDLGINVEEY